MKSSRPIVDLVAVHFLGGLGPGFSGLGSNSSSMIGAKLARCRHLFNLFKMAANKSSRKHDVIVTPPGGSGSQTVGWVTQVKLSGRQMNLFKMAPKKLEK